MKTEAEVVIDDSEIWEEINGLWVPSQKRHRAEFAELLGAPPPTPELSKPEPTFVKPPPKPAEPEPIIKVADSVATETSLDREHKLYHQGRNELFWDSISSDKPAPTTFLGALSQPVPAREVQFSAPDPRREAIEMLKDPPPKEPTSAERVQYFMNGVLRRNVL